MKSKRILILSAMCVLAGIGVIAFWPGEREPRYNGKKLSKWLDIYVSGPKNNVPQKEALWALQAMGTNALPFLLRLAQRDVTGWQGRVVGKCKQIGFTWPQQLASKRFREFDAAWLMMSSLGTSARPAIPAVSRMALESQSINVAFRSINFLSANGPDGIPAILEIIEKGKIDCRRRALAAIGQTRDLGTNGPAVIDVLLKCLQDEDQVVAENAVLSLFKIAFIDKKIVPILTERLRDTHGMVRYCASRALGVLGNHHGAIPELREAVPVLINAQNDPYPLVREWATNALLKIAPEVLTNGVKKF